MFIKTPRLDSHMELQDAISSANELFEGLCTGTINDYDDDLAWDVQNAAIDLRKAIEAIQADIATRAAREHGEYVKDNTPLQVELA